MTELRLAGVARLLPPRPSRSHKGDFGWVLVVAGSRGMTGAAVLSASAAAGSGAGLVALAVPRSQQPAVAAQVQEVLTWPLSETRQGSLHPNAAPEILDFIRSKGCDILVLGPGLSTNPSTRRAVFRILEQVDFPVVVDADALNALSCQSGTRLKNLFSSRRSPAVLTPHPGEMARLLKTNVRNVQADRGGCALRLAREWGIVCVLKGHRTVISDGRRLYRNTTGNPGLAKGGTGDVLAGMLAAFWAQVCFPSRYTIETALAASCLAVYVHGLCGDLAARELTQQGLLARDLVRYLPSALRKIRKAAG